MATARLANMPAVGLAEGGIATPEGLREHLAQFAECGVDQVSFIQQGGRNRHEHICEALELFAAEVMGEFKEREADRARKKEEELAPFIEAALKRKSYMPPLADAQIAPVIALGRQIAEQAALDGTGPAPNPRREAWTKALRAGEGAGKASI